MPRGVGVRVPLSAQGYFRWRIFKFSIFFFDIYINSNHSLQVLILKSVSLSGAYTVLFFRKKSKGAFVFLDK